MSKNVKQLIRITVCLTAFIVLFALEKTIGFKGYLGLGLYLPLYIAIGCDVLWRAVRNITRGKIFDENFLMSIATIGAFGLSQYPEAVAVMLFYQVGELFQSYAVGKSRKSIAALMDIRPDKAVILKEGREVEVTPEEVAVGDVLVVRPGERVPLDGVIVRGAGSLDTSALTGESVPRAAAEGDLILSGSINLTGVLHIRAEKEFYDSTVAKILEMVENASSKKAKAENFISKFARYYTPAVVFCALLLAVIPPLLPVYGGQWIEWLTRALTFLVISCPCALVISVPMSFFGGLGCASRRGVLFKGASYLELIQKANIFVFDKTGTLTKGVFGVRRVNPESRRAEILQTAAYAEFGSLHPIAKSIMAEVGDFDAAGYGVTEHIGKGLEAEKDGTVILAGNEKLMRDNNIQFTPADEVGSVVYVAKDGKFLGSIVIADTIREDAKQVIEALKAEGVRTIMLTGDNEKFAAYVAREAGVDEYASGLLPADKVMRVEAVMESKTAKDAVAFVGDGINDAPVLMRADLGISMGGIGSDSAVEASDTVLMHDKLTSITEARRIGKRTLKLVYQNIFFILLVKAVVLVLGAMGIASMWLAVFADVGVSVLAILNAMRALKYK